MLVIGPATDTKARNTCIAIEEGQGRSTIDGIRYGVNPIGCTQSDFIGNGAFYVAYATFGV